MRTVISFYKKKGKQKKAHHGKSVSEKDFQNLGESARPVKKEAGQSGNNESKTKTDLTHY